MKLRQILFISGLCALTVSAETTLELFQQRAEAGDVTAQTFLGLAYQYGYGVATSREQALNWFSKAAEQGDSFAIQRRDLFGKPITTVYRTVTAVRPEQVKDDLPAKIAQGMSSPYAGRIGFDELVVHRDQYVGKVIELEFKTVSALGGAVPYIYVKDPRSVQGQSGPSDKLHLDGESALEWRLDVERKSPDAVSRIYALVEKDRLIALGARRSKTTDGGCTYSW